MATSSHLRTFVRSVSAGGSRAASSSKSKTFSNFYEREVIDKVPDEYRQPLHLFTRLSRTAAGKRREAMKPEKKKLFPHHVNQGKATYDARGRRILLRPPREIPVRLASGHLEPKTYPPGEEYLVQIQDDTPSVHPLWSFFDVPAGARERPHETSEQPQFQGSITLQTGDDVDKTRQAMDTSRAWTAAELRLKSFSDLHTLWWILLRELNLLNTQLVEMARLETYPPDSNWLKYRKKLCRRSMKGIKFVLNERRLGLIAAMGPLTKVRERLPARADPNNQQDAISYTWQELRSHELRRLQDEKDAKSGAAASAAMAAGSKSPLDTSARSTGSPTFAPPADAAGAGAMAAGASATAAAGGGEDEDRVAPQDDDGELDEEDEYDEGLGEDEEWDEELDDEEYEDEDELDEDEFEEDDVDYEEFEDDEAVVNDEEVAKKEIEGRDEGFGGGKEAEDFVENTKTK